jgi:hypothetical protein
VGLDSLCGFLLPFVDTHPPDTTTGVPTAID